MFQVAQTEHCRNRFTRVSFAFILAMSSSEFEELYGDFEAHFARRVVGDRLSALLRQAASSGDAGRLPIREEMVVFHEQFLPVGYGRCVEDNFETPRPNCLRSEPARCGNRCASAYWQKHSSEVSANMRRIAEWLGHDADEYEMAGLVHDIDYLRYPHHNTRVSSEDAHPISVVKLLMSRGVRPSFSLAILEHAPHLGHDPSSPLAWALAACDEHSTICGASQEPQFDPLLPAELIACLQMESGPAITGYVRPDVHERMNAGLWELSRARRA